MKRKVKPSCSALNAASSTSNGIFLANAREILNQPVANRPEVMSLFTNKSPLGFVSFTLFLACSIPSSLFAQSLSVSNLSGYHRNGQVFLTWQNTDDPFSYYKIYRSTNPITSSTQLAACEYLGYTNSESSKDHNLSRHDGFDHFLVLDSGSAPLSSTTGLFVATTLVAGNYYYAVTTLENGVEETSITLGLNALEDPIPEIVEEPQPIFQQSRLVGDRPIDIYATFASMKYAVDSPLMNKAGFITNDFAVYRNGAVSGQHPLRLRFHGGGADFLFNVTGVTGDEINLNPEDFFPDGDNSSWWGANENYNIYNTDSNQVPPASGLNYNFCHQRVTRLINWAIAHLPVDSNRIYLEGTSLGSIGAYFYTMLYPERIAAVKLSGSVFDLSFEDDYNPICTLNEGGGNRVSGNNRYGTISTNLMSNLGYPFYDVVNANWLTSTFIEKDFPIIYSINGKNDTIVGWTEKTIYYKSVNANHTGGYYFYDGRKHGGGDGVVWGDENFDIFKYSRNSSFPAFANCSANEDPGDGHATDGAPFGSVNGFLDWENDIVDDASKWTANLYLKDLMKFDHSTYPAPDFCTADVTLRRRQQFLPIAGETLWWNVVYNNDVIQSGQQVYQGGIITIPQVTIYKEGVQLQVAIDSASLTGSLPDESMIAYPNPFATSVTIRWQVNEQGKCLIKIFDVQGRVIKTLLDGDFTPGIHQVNWNGDNDLQHPVSNGVYLLRLDMPDHSETKKVIVGR